MRVLVVDDSAFMRKVISEMIRSDPAFEVVAIARDGEDGVRKALEYKPDLITLDIEMPKMDGLSALREIKLRCHDFNPAVLMCSSLTLAGSAEALKALRIGACDVIGKDPSSVGKGDRGFKQELLAKLHAIGEHRATIISPLGSPAPRAAGTEQAHNSQTGAIDLSRVGAVVVGSSTGGPPALEEIFSGLSPDLDVPIVVAQHMPELFTKSLANRLDQQCACRVSLATHGVMLSEPGVYIAQGGRHIKPTRVAGGKVVARLVESVEGLIYRPSVDYLFSHAAEIYGDKLLAIQLTGMGADGALGAKDIKGAGGQVIAQSGHTCVVYGMPRAVIELGLADCILDPPAIRNLLAKLGSVSKSEDIREYPNQAQRRSA